MDRDALVTDDRESMATLTAYFGERMRVADALLADALLDRFAGSGVAASMLLRGVEGFGLRHHLRTDSSLSLSEDLPAVAVAFDTAARIEQLHPEVRALVSRGFVSVTPAGTEPAELADATAVRLTVYLRRQDRIGGRPAHVAVCAALHDRGVDGASALLGVDGTLHGTRHRARFFARNSDVPMQVVAVGSLDSVTGALAELRTLLNEPIVTLTPVRVCKRDGVTVEGPPAEASGWQQLTVFTSEAQLFRGRPIHREITRRLRSSGARGATTLRGIWGYHLPHAPHGDRPLRLGRHVPTVTIAIDECDRIARSYEIIDALTGEHGLVTSAPVTVG